MNSKRVLFCAAMVTALMLAERSALAASITVDSVGDAFKVSVSGLSDDNVYPVGVEQTWEVTAINPTSVTFKMTLANTSATSPSRLTGFAFDTAPDATGGSSTNSVYANVFAPGSGFDVCVKNKDNNGNCFGNQGNVGLRPGDPSEEFFLTLLFGDTSGGVTLSNFFFRLQGIGTANVSAKLYGDPECTSCDVDEEGDPVPEPATMLMTGLAAAAGLARRARRSVQS